jgi:hypothetical protein
MEVACIDNAVARILLTRVDLYSELDAELSEDRGVRLGPRLKPICYGWNFVKA